MKKALKPILISVCLAIAAALAVTAVIFFIPRDNTSFSWECFRLRLAVSGFLKDVEGERYGDAVDSLYCTSLEDGLPTEADDACRKAWVERVSALKKANTYLEDFSKLKVRKENGEFTVTVTLKVLRDGVNDPFYAKGTTVSVVEKDGWKISGISEYSYDLQTDLERALSGAFSAEERS